MKLVSIVTVNFNHAHVTEALLESVARKNTYLPLEIIVVDNGSSDNPVAVWEQQYPHIRFIRSETNLGFAGGNNLGLQAAKGDYLFLINNDTEITEGLIPTLTAYLDTNPSVGMISPKIHYYEQPKMLQYAGYTPLNYFTGRNSCIGQFEEDKGQYDHLTGATGYAHGAAMMVRKEAILKAGLMDENYFLYYEELDWCERIKKCGYEVHVVMNALIRHKESVSVGKKSALKEFFMNRNRILFIRKHASDCAQIVFWCYFVLVVIPRNILQYIKNGQTGFIKILFRAVKWNLTNGTNSRNLGYPVQ